MKLIMAIVPDIDCANVMSALNREGYYVTKLASTGGFLKSGNTTLMIGVENEKVQTVVDVIRAKCEGRKKVMVNSAPNMMDSKGSAPFPVEVDVGGATLFVLNIDRFEKI